MKYLIAALLVWQVFLQAECYSFNYVKNFVRNGNLNKVRDLIQEGVDVNMVGPSCNKSLLQWAALSGVPAVARILLENGANSNYQEKGTGMTALMYATSRNHADVAKVLMDHNANKNVRDTSGRTAMDHAKEKGYYDNMIEVF